MSLPEIPPNVKLITAVTFQHGGQLKKMELFLTERFGVIDLRSPEFPFDFTEYYKNEMGENLQKLILSFERLIPRERLPAIKILTNTYEADTAELERRSVNIDPGYIGEASLILASVKNFSHRIYLANGIYGDPVNSICKWNLRGLPPHLRKRGISSAAVDLCGLPAAAGSRFFCRSP